ncbi:MAG: cation-translocating P-type ATPase [Candidatus Nanoarchaeia archaeon]
MEFYREDAEKVLKELQTQNNGLSKEEARERLKEQGENKLNTEKKISPLKIFLNQFKSFIIYLLFIAVFLSLLIGQVVSAMLIFGILILNALIGFFQEYSTQKSLKALQKLNYISARAYRNNKLTSIDSKKLVAGDIVYLEAGDIVPADCRILEINRLEVEESSLTGESKPVKKFNEKIKQKVDLGDRKNMVFSSTVVTKGYGWAVVVKTGMDTEIGKITAMVRDVEEEQTPLQRRLERFGKKLSYAILGICLLIFLMLLYTEGFSIDNLNKFALVALGLAVAAVPTVLPSVVTITLSVGVNRLLKKNALVRNLASVETLGSCDVICTDKTGTLTKNEMTVIKAATFNSEANISGLGYAPEGKIDNKLEPLLFKIGELCNNSKVFKKGKEWRISGDPTEAALKVSAQKAKIKAKGERLDELPFDSNRKMMSVLVKEGKNKYMHTKGAPDEILRKSKYYLSNGRVYNLTKKKKDELLQKNMEYAKEGLRVLAFAYKKISKKEEFRENNLVVVGLQAMEDPPRPDVIESLKKAENAGIRVIMVTGDFKETAQAIAKQIGIKGNVLEGRELRRMSDKELHKALVNNCNVFARVIPEDKQRIVRQLQKEEHVVAMTGDGVNDAPALKKANIGVAIGTGTDVAKEASDFVLLNNSFSNIVNAVEEGRGTYDNIQKSITLLLSGNFSEILVIFFAIIFGWSLPLTAVMLLWINLIANGAPAIAFSVDPYDSQIMKRKPLDLNMSILPKDKLSLIGFVGITGSFLSLILFYIYGGAKYTVEDAGLMLPQTIVFTYIVSYELLHVFMIRDEYNVKQLTNGWLWASIFFSFMIQAGVLYTPVHEYFKVVPLATNHLAAIGIMLVIFMSLHMIYNKFAKWYFRQIYYAD